MSRLGIKNASNGNGIWVHIPNELLLQMRDCLINQPGLTTKPPKERTPLEDLAIKVTARADRYEKVKELE